MAPIPKILAFFISAARNAWAIAILGVAIALLLGP